MTEGVCGLALQLEKMMVCQRYVFVGKLFFFGVFLIVFCHCLLLISWLLCLWWLAWLAMNF